MNVNILGFKNDSIPVSYNTANNIISLNQGVRIRNIIDPVEELDHVNKKYVDSKVLTKNLVGYILNNPTLYDFIIQTGSGHKNEHKISNIFNDDLNSLWEDILEDIIFFLI